ncbi:MAG: GNAT family N-acetyltransferase [Proteobacteria bacterium]|nr:MAG: GNAT family N-acetyltransferase [Pseudomonadota bacterium]
MSRHNIKSESSWSVHWLSDLEIPLANKFYRSHGFRGKARRNEDCAVVRDANQSVIACGCLRNHGSFRLLAGVAVAETNQRQGVARLLVRRMSERFDSQTYTFPYDHLMAFYQSLGFAVVHPEGQITPLTDLYQSYRKQGRSILMMQYLPDS